MLKFLLLLLSSQLAGCLTLPHQVERRLVGNQVVEVHTDAPADPCAENAAGCYEFATRRVFLRSPVRPDTVQHELAHADGMIHGPWLADPLGRKCAAVIVGDRGGLYPAGSTICLDRRGEYVFKGAPA